jgi:hypothetical protein
MTLPDGYWPSLLDDYVAAYQQAFPSAGGAAERTPSRNALLLACSVAEHETNNGRAWPGTNNFGAVQLRGLTLQEKTAFDDGNLKAGDYTPDRTGVLHVDTHPSPSGSIPYPVWFAAFDERTDGIAHYLKALYRLSDSEPDKDDATCASVVLHMYEHGYFEEFDHHRGIVRPVGKRVPPLLPEEQARVDDYAGAVNGCLAMIAGALTSWDYGRDANLEPGDPRDTLPPAA